MKIYLLNHQNWGTLFKGRQENPDYIAKYIKQRKRPENNKKRRCKISKGILQLFVIVIMINRINSLIKAKRTFTLGQKLISNLCFP